MKHDFLVFLIFFHSKGLQAFQQVNTNIPHQRYWIVDPSQRKEYSHRNMTHQHLQSHSLESFLAFKFKPPRNTTSCPPTPITNQYTRSTLHSTTPKRSLLRDHAKHQKTELIHSQRTCENHPSPQTCNIKLVKSYQTITPEAYQPEKTPEKGKSSSKPTHVHSFSGFYVNLPGVYFSNH